jgi:hypothetical protein
VTRRHKLLHVLANYSLGFWGWSDFCFTPKMWWCSDVLFGAWVDTSWQAMWHCIIDRSRSWSSRANWHSWTIHPRSRSVKLEYNSHPLQLSKSEKSSQFLRLNLGGKKHKWIKAHECHLFWKWLLSTITIDS